MTRIRCTFRPQAWVNNYAIDIDIDGPNEWEMEVESLPEENSDESDELRQDPAAPSYVREHRGPFEVDYEVIEE